jgi:hypothetical protein
MSVLTVPLPAYHFKYNVGYKAPHLVTYSLNEFTDIIIVQSTAPINTLFVFPHIFKQKSSMMRSALSLVSLFLFQGALAQIDRGYTFFWEVPGIITEVRSTSKHRSSLSLKCM